VKRGDDATSTELIPIEKFKDFVRRVVAVPKKEIDRRLEEQRARRQRTKHR